MNTTFDRILWRKNKNTINYPVVKKTLLFIGYIIETKSQSKISAVKKIDHNHRFHFIIDKPVYANIIYCGINLHKDIYIKKGHVSLENDNDIKIELIKFCKKLNELILEQRKLKEYEDLMFKFRWN